MGSATSKNKTESYINAMTNITMDIMQSCSQHGDQQQRIVIIGNRNVVSKIKMVQELTLQQECIQSNEFNATLIDDLSTELAAQAEAITNGIFSMGGFSRAEVEAAARADIIKTIELGNTQVLEQKVAQIQEIVISGDENVVSSIKMQQISKQLQSSIQEFLATIDSYNKIVTMIETAANAEAKSFLDGFFEMIGGIIGIVIGVIMLIVVIVVVPLVSEGMEVSGHSQHSQENAES